jgi:trehalose 6-phosphate synthase
MITEWFNDARTRELTLLLDMDGTLIPFAATPEEAVVDGVVVELLQGLTECAHVAVVSGRTEAMLTDVAARLPAVYFVGEHGAWRAEQGHGAPVYLPSVELDELEAALRALAAGAPGAIIERKRCSVCLHWRQVPPGAREALITAAESRVEEWLEVHGDFERLDGVENVEVRHRAVHKGTAVQWMRARFPGARLLAIGDDVTDEDLFASLGPDDLGVAVGHGRRTRARARVDGVPEVRALLGWLRASRLNRAGGPPMPTVYQVGAVSARAPQRLLVVSNRLPAPPARGRHREVGGLASALELALRRHEGVWLGWSGRDRDPGLAIDLDLDAAPPRAHFDYPSGWRTSFYGGFCNRSLWPLMHCMPDRARYVDEEWHAYVEANRAYARLASELVESDAAVWAQDYHLLLVGQELRQRGHTGRLGMFLHVPFPPKDVFDTMPWARPILTAMLDFDVLGFHTHGWARNFVDCVDQLVGPGRIRPGQIGVFPIGTDPDRFAAAGAAADRADVSGMRLVSGDRKLLLGVDRLDYSKGIPARLEAFARLLELFPQWRGQVSFVQVSVPSRSDVPEYAELRDKVEHLVGRINGSFGEADWVPVRYLYRSYEPDVLAQLYRAADVAIVTPLRDGMNLVAKEFVAAQDPDDPGVMLLSRFAGAAEEMTAALLTNPWHIDGMAADLDVALRMPRDERIARHRQLAEVVWRDTAERWADSFLDKLLTK